MPEPPKPAHADRHDRYAVDPPMAKDADDAKPLHGADNGARLFTPGDRSPARPNHDHADRYDSDGYASADVPPALPPYRENSRYDSPTPPQRRRHRAWARPIQAAWSAPRRPCRLPNMTGDYRREAVESRSDGGLRHSRRGFVVQQSRRRDATTASTKCSRTTATGRFPRGSTARAHISRP